MTRNLGLDEVVDHFTLIGDELELLRDKPRATRLGWRPAEVRAVARAFPSGSPELPDDAVAHLARQVGVPAAELASYDFTSRTAQRHRTEIRAYAGRPARRSDTPDLPCGRACAPGTTPCIAADPIRPSMREVVDMLATSLAGAHPVPHAG